MDNDDDNYADPANLIGKHDGRVKKKEKGGHRHRYRNDDKINDLHGLYKEPKEDNNNGCDDDKEDNDGDRYVMEEK